MVTSNRINVFVKVNCASNPNYTQGFKPLKANGNYLNGHNRIFLLSQSNCTGITFFNENIIQIGSTFIEIERFEVFDVSLDFVVTLQHSTSMGDVTKAICSIDVKF